MTPDHVSVTLHDTHDTSKVTRLGAVFREWAGPDADYRVIFTPDALIGVSDDSRRGYLFDDGWTVECWIERGAAAFLRLVHAEFPPHEHSVEVDHPHDPAPMKALTASAIDNGQPIAAVRHLLGQP